ESDALLGLLGSVSITHLAQGPYSQGTGFMFLYHMLTAGAGGYKRVRYARGGMDNLIAALAEKATSQGVEIQTSTAVQQILLDNGRATGIQLTDGTTITAERVISTTTPKQTMFGMVGAPNLPPSIVRRVKNGIYRGITAKLNLSLRELPAFNGQTAAEQLHGHIVISPSLDYLERAFDATKYGRIAEKPYLDMVLRKAHDGSGAYTLAMTMQYAPYHLRGTDWASQRDTLSKIILGTLEEYATGIRDLITGQTLWTPLDLEEQFGLTEGSVTHGQMELGQMFALRPVLSGSGPSQRPFETVIPNLYIAGSGAHPGGGFTGRPGLMAAQVLLAEA
ncbi:MAG: NAD(P)/FAD-dependent oxidoreductase, partial [Anaerolineales bacterium]|nr:NAD(P)/FAD-dependent oxidoreductase [Anaerolineales bacterium]